MSKADDIFYREFAAILLALVLFCFIVFFVARSIGANAFEKMQTGPRVVSQRIEPVGKVRVGDPAKTVAAATSAPEPAAAAAPTDSGAGKSGDEIYKSACMACHATGAAGAPKMGDKVAWEPRVGQGMDGLTANAIKGKGAMPAKGGAVHLSDDEIKAAVEYMLEQTGVTPG